VTYVYVARPVCLVLFCSLFPTFPSTTRQYRTAGLVERARSAIDDLQRMLGLPVRVYLRALSSGYRDTGARQTSRVGLSGLSSLSWSSELLVTKAAVCWPFCPVSIVLK